MIKRSRHISVFRLAAVLSQQVDPVILQQALKITLRRLPFFAVRLRRGFFWYYLETCTRKPYVEQDVQNPLRPWNRNDEKGYLFRVRYYHKRIAVEFFHALTDGYGGSVFLKTLIASYFTLQDVKITPGYGVLNVLDPASDEEMEDAYRRYSDFKVIRRPTESKAFNLQGTILPGHHFYVISGKCSVTDVSRAARASQVSVTELLTAVYIYQLYRIQQQGGYNTAAPIRVSVPINVRRYYPTATLRNFALYANPGIEPAFGEYTFIEVLQLVHHFMRYTINSKYLNAMMCANVRPEKSWLLRLSPIWLKNLAMRIGYKISGESRFTGTLSNLGNQFLPVEMSGRVEHLEFILGPSKLNPVNCAVISLSDQLVISFSSTMEETEVQRAFFRHLVELGIPVCLHSNLNGITRQGKG